MNKLSRKDIAMLEALAVTEESKGKLAEYIQQREKAAKAYKVFREAVVAEVEVPNVEKSANELRAEIIQRAKDFVVKESRGGFISIDSPVCVVYVNFVVNAKKRTVVAFLKGVLTGKVYSKGIAKCNPDDVFNEHISKVIALGRALGKDVSEFENAVQPTKAIYGMIVERLREKGVYLKVSPFHVRNETCTIGSKTAKFGKIIDDTHAIYKEGTE